MARGRTTLRIHCDVTGYSEMTDVPSIMLAQFQLAKTFTVYGKIATEENSIVITNIQPEWRQYNWICVGMRMYERIPNIQKKGADFKLDEEVVRIRCFAKNRNGSWCRNFSDHSFCCETHRSENGVLFPNGIVDHGVIRDMLSETQASAEKSLLKSLRKYDRQALRNQRVA